MEDDRDFLAHSAVVTELLFFFLRFFSLSIVPVVIMFGFFLRFFSVSDSMMQSTLSLGDKVIALDFCYDPKNGDVVVIRKHGALKKNIIRRIIAIQGQRLAVDSSGVIFVDSSKIDENYIEGKTKVENCGDVPDTVPENCVFVLGDNRGSAKVNTQEAHVIKTENIVGRAVFVYYPFARFGIVK